MATMHPSNMSTIIFPNQSEKKVYEQLQSQLKSKIHVFYSLQWQSQQSGKTKMGEADFVIVDPDNGLLVLEAKGGYRIEHSNNTWRLWNTSSAGDIRTLKESPYEQARKSLFDMVDYYCFTQNRRMSFTYASAVIFPFYDVPDNLSIERTNENTIQFSDMNELQKKINHVFYAYRQPSHNMTKDDFDRVIDMLSGCTTSTPPVGAFYQKSLFDLSETAAAQDVILSMLYNYDQAIIAGPAGTGKTYMAITKTIEYGLQGLDVLYVCFNRLNAEKVNEYVSSSQCHADCLTFHQLIKREVGASIYAKKFSEDKSLSWVSGTINSNSCHKYDAIIVDEGQDFSEEWALALRTFFIKNETSSKFFVFYDEDQNIFQRDFAEAFMIAYPPFLLRKNLRNTRVIWDWIVNVTSMGRHSLPNDVTGLVPEVYKARNQNLALNWLEKKIRELFENGIKPADIAILSDFQYQNTCLANSAGIADTPLIDITSEEMHSDCIHFCTVQAYKGLESPVVFCLEKGDSDPKLRYVAYSRAKCLLFVIKY